MTCLPGSGRVNGRRLELLVIDDSGDRKDGVSCGDRNVGRGSWYAKRLTG
jgi:hypothetical protein